jgi:hypothetical protein
MDETAKTGPGAVAAAPAGDDAGVAEPETGGPAWRVGGESGATWLAQLQAMIDNIATQAGPVVREVAAKAAELAAVAADHAGPIARRAAAVTQDVSVKVAEKSRRVAADLRHTAEQGRGPESAAAAPESPAPETPAAPAEPEH